jgi:uncharacterized protein YjdB
MKLITFFAASCCCIAQAQSPYIHKVFDYMPAPGQFVNELPAYEPGDTQDDMNRKVEEYIAGAHHNEGMISLGGYGGYVVFGFDHEVQNLAGRFDFRILGNAFYANDNPNGNASREGGSCEPGIVMVARDANANGIPDDPWYELAGSDYRRPTTLHNYRITYYRPDENKTPVPHPTERHVIDTEYVHWTTNGHGNGFVHRNDYHSQPYFPLWAEGDELSFTGTKLADNYVDESGLGAYYVLYALHWGYADNHPNADKRSAFNIEWAVDDAGNPVALPGIHFVKVYTAVNQNCGWIGETSTEIGGAEDLHLTGRDAEVPIFVNGIRLNRTSAELYPESTLSLTATLSPVNASNQAITWRSSAPDVASVTASGAVTAHRAGTARIQAIANDGYYLAECSLNVRSGQEGEPEPGGPALSSLSLNLTQLDLAPGETFALVATLSPADASGVSLQWTSSDTRVAEVTVNGLVWAGEAGEAVISVSAQGGHTASCLVRVATAPVAVEAPSVQPPRLRYVEGRLHLLHLDGYHCTLYSTAGTPVGTLRPSSPDEWHTCPLPPGIYILHARKAGEQLSFKLIVGN